MLRNRRLKTMTDVRRLCNRHHVAVVWVRGHDGNAENEQADQLANEARRHEDS